MFLSVKERARQIANGQFTAPTTNTSFASPADHALQPKPVVVAAAKTTCPPGSSVKPTVSPLKSNSKPSKSKSQVSTAQHAASETSLPLAAPSETPKLKKSFAKPKVSAESTTKSSSPKIGSSKFVSTNRAVSAVQAPSIPKVVSTTKAKSTTKSTTSKPASAAPKSKRSRSPPKRVDSPIDENDDSLSSLKSTCLKQISGVTGLGGRRLTIVLKQRSSGEWFAALKDTGSDKYLKMWTNRDKTFATKEEALEAYLAFVTRMRNEVRWFPMSPKASSPKSKV